MKKNYGIIVTMPGMQKVGEFDSFTAEDCYGRRNLAAVKLEAYLFDLSKKQSTSNYSLKFMYAEELSPGNYRQIDDLGYGLLTGAAIVDNKQVYLQLAEFIKEPKNIKSLNN